MRAVRYYRNARPLFAELIKWAETSFNYPTNQTSQLLIQFGKDREHRVSMVLGLGMTLTIAALEQCVGEQGQVFSPGDFRRAMSILRRLPPLVEDAIERLEFEEAVDRVRSAIPVAA